VFSGNSVVYLVAQDTAYPGSVTFADCDFDRGSYASANAYNNAGVSTTACSVGDSVPSLESGCPLDSPGLSRAAIGGIVGAVVGVTLIVAVALFCYCRRRRARDSSRSKPEENRSELLWSSLANSEVVE
jgi:hypothetical protein